MVSSGSCTIHTRKIYLSHASPLCQAILFGRFPTVSWFWPANVEPHAANTFDPIVRSQDSNIKLGRANIIPWKTDGCNIGERGGKKKVLKLYKHTKNYRIVCLHTRKLGHDLKSQIYANSESFLHFLPRSSLRWDSPNRLSGTFLFSKKINI